jgi:hypothetical protein
MNICVFNPTTTLIDVVDSSTLLPAASTVSAIAQVNLAQGALVNLSQAQASTPLLASLADASLGLPAMGYVVSPMTAGLTTPVSMTGVVTVAPGNFTVANIGATVYLSTAGTFSLTPSTSLYQNVGTILTVTTSEAQIAFYGSNPAYTIDQLSTVAYIPAPVFNGELSNSFKITLTGNVTSSTFVNGGLLGKPTYYFRIVQDSVGGHTFVWPTNVRNGGVPNPNPNARSVQAFALDTDGSLDAIGPIMDS